MGKPCNHLVDYAAARRVWNGATPSSPFASSLPSHLAAWVDIEAQIGNRQ